MLYHEIAESELPLVVIAPKLNIHNLILTKIIKTGRYYNLYIRDTSDYTGIYQFDDEELTAITGLKNI